MTNIQEIKVEDEVLTEFVASESTMGSRGQYREAGIGRFNE